MTLPSRRSAPIAVMLLHPACNMTCTFCVTEEDFDPLGFAQARALLDHLRGRGCSSVIFGGGEPFAWPGDLLRLAAEARARGLLVQVGTNGIALPEGFANRDCIDRWILPLESADAAVHDRLRRHGPGHHALILARMEALKQAGRSFTVSTVLTAANTGGLPELSRLLLDHHRSGGRVHAWHLYQFLPFGRGGARHQGELSISPEAYAQACAAIQGLELPFRVFRRSDMYRSSSIEFFWSRGGRILSGSSPAGPGILG